MKTPAQPRWLLSFTDLALLLLAFFIVLHVRQNEADRIVQGIGGALGPQSLHPRVHGFAADSLFEAGEAMLRPDAHILLDGAGKNWKPGRKLIITSTGQSSASARFDTWDLSAARTAAIARHLSQSGIPADAIDVEMEPASPQKTGQQIMIRFRSL